MRCGSEGAILLMLGNPLRDRPLHPLAVAGEEAFPLPVLSASLEWLARPKGVNLSQARRDRDDPVVTCRIGFPSHDGFLRDEDI